MKVGIIDVGSNTVRLLVAQQLASGDLDTVRAERAQMGLGEQIERLGRLSPTRMKATARKVARYARDAEAEGCEIIDLVVTAPGRQSRNGARLVNELERASGMQARVLSVEQEGRLAYAGALRGMAAPLYVGVAVCDVGGGSTELAIGHSRNQPQWIRSFDIGSLRLTSRHLDADPPSRRDVRKARATVHDILAYADPPAATLGLATGGAARALRRVVGRMLGPDELAAAIEITTSMSSSKLAKRTGIDPERARTVTAGAIILAEVQELMGMPLEVARGGLREGLAGELFSRALTRVA